MSTPEQLPPAYDLPTCPKCKTATGVPIRTAEGGRFYPPKDGRAPRIWCAACGNSWHGTDAEVWKANRAEKAWEFETAAEEAKAKADAEHRELLRKFELAKQGRWK